MENNGLPLKPEQPEPFWVAAKQWLFSTVTFSAEYFLAVPLLEKVLNRTTPLKEIYKRNFNTSSILTVTALSGIVEMFLSAPKAYREAKQQNEANDKLWNDNIAMRQQLNQTGQILNHVAGQIEKGQMPNSKLALDETTTPPTHVAKLEAEKAAQALAEVSASPTVH